MKKILLILTIVFTTVSFAQQSSKTNKLYNPADDAKLEIETAVKLAKNQGKHVMLQIGGNWCKWCIAFDKKVKGDEVLYAAMNDNYVVYHLNYSKENKNEEILSKLGNPQRFGFPVFVVLDGEGNRLHTQNSGLLEGEEGHDTKKVLSFLKNWSPKALLDR